MPELAEVEFFRRRWQEAAHGETVLRVLAHEGARPLRGIARGALGRALAGRKLLSSQAAAKQMLFRFGAKAWLGVHLGMSGELRVEGAGYAPARHDHLVLVTARHALVYSDPRMFGRLQLHVGPEAPAWWTRIAPPLLSAPFTAAAVAAFLRRRARAPIKAVLLMQERFPGVGNWMADEILWRAGVHPRKPAGALTPAEIRALWRECRWVARSALRVIAGRGGRLPPDLNVGIPDSWLFWHRWQAGGRCPKTGVLLRRAEIGGRTTCWSPARQKL
jgi:formamidopyrimidine-DNA glycosylase